LFVHGGVDGGVTSTMRPDTDIVAAFVVVEFDPSYRSAR